MDGDKTLDEVAEQEIGGDKVEVGSDLNQEQFQQPGVGELFARLFKVLKTPPGKGPVEEYVNVSWNFNRSMWMAKILKGLAGFLGQLEFAIVYIISGLIEWRNGGKSNGQ